MIIRQEPLVLPEALYHCDQMDAAFKYLRKGGGSAYARILCGADGWAVRGQLLTESGKRGADLRRAAA